MEPRGAGSATVLRVPSSFATTTNSAGATAATLIEQDDSVRLRIEEAACAIVAPRAGTAMYEHRRFAVRIAAFLVIDLVQLRDAQIARVVRLD